MNTDDYDKLQNLAKEGLTSQMTITAQNRQAYELRLRISELNKELDNLYAKTKDFFTAMRLDPEKVRTLFTSIIDQRKGPIEQKQSTWRIKYGGHNAR